MSQPKKYMKKQFCIRTNFFFIILIKFFSLTAKGVFSSGSPASAHCQSVSSMCIIFSVVLLTTRCQHATTHSTLIKRKSSVIFVQTKNCTNSATVCANFLLFVLWCLKVGFLFIYLFTLLYFCQRIPIRLIN